MWNSYQLYGKIISIDEIEEMISKISLNDIKELANEIFDESKYSITILGEI